MLLNTLSEFIKDLCWKKMTDLKRTLIEINCCVLFVDYIER